MRARPTKFSDSTGLRLCGIAEEPFCPSEKNSSASSTSVRCRWRISVASRSTEDAITPRVAKYIASRSRGMTCVETGAGASELGIGISELQAESHGLGMDAVGATDRRRHLVLEGALLQRRQHAVDV